tara:strand:- start:245 stop:481 length:237 start_codon:yes stop_codon:yes gene_type:complete
MNDLLDLTSKFLLISDVLAETDKEKVANKERIVFATMKKTNPYWEKPSDWDELPTDEKLRRLNKIQKMLIKENNNGKK